MVDLIKLPTVSLVGAVASYIAGSTGIEGLCVCMLVRGRVDTHSNS